jgi:hypothetical protein
MLPSLRLPQVVSPFLFLLSFFFGRKRSDELMNRSGPCNVPIGPRCGPCRSGRKEVDSAMQPSSANWLLQIAIWPRQTPVTVSRQRVIVAQLGLLQPCAGHSLLGPWLRIQLAVEVEPPCSDFRRHL